MAQRGVYRSLFSALFDDPDFQHLSHTSRLLLLTLRLCKQTGPAAIFRYYPSILAAQTGLSLAQIKGSMSQLAAAGWIVYDATVVWVRNGLRYDPMINLANARQRKGVERAVAELPKSSIVLKFCEYYEIVKPYDSLSIGYEGPTSPNTDTPNTEEARNTEIRALPAQPPDDAPNGFHIDPSILEALDDCPAFRGVRRLRAAPYWQAQLQAYNADFPVEVRKAQAWLAANPRRIKGDMPRFLSNWFARAHVEDA